MRVSATLARLADVMRDLDLSNLPDPYVYRVVWGIPIHNQHGFDLLVARQLIWLPYARPAVRGMLFNAAEEPICPACDSIVATGEPTVVCVAVLADRELQQRIAEDATAIVVKNPDGLEAWWLLHGSCLDTLTTGRVRELDQRIEMALRAAAREN